MLRRVIVPVVAWAIVGCVAVMMVVAHRTPDLTTQSGPIWRADAPSARTRAFALPVVHRPPAFPPVRSPATESVPAVHAASPARPAATTPAVQHPAVTSTCVPVGPPPGRGSSKAKPQRCRPPSDGGS